jgi:hypothetical protein
MELACKLGGQNDTSATDVPLVEKILAKFPDIAAFNATIKNVADDMLKDFREDYRWGLAIDLGLPDMGLYTFEASKGDENKCGKCDNSRSITTPRNVTARYQWMSCVMTSF